MNRSSEKNKVLKRFIIALPISFFLYSIIVFGTSWNPSCLDEGTMCNYTTNCCGELTCINNTCTIYQPNIIAQLQYPVICLTNSCSNNTFLPFIIISEPFYFIDGLQLWMIILIVIAVIVAFGYKKMTKKRKPQGEYVE